MHNSVIATYLYVKVLWSHIQTGSQLQPRTGAFIEKLWGPDLRGPTRGEVGPYSSTHSDRSIRDSVTYIHRARKENDAMALDVAYALK